jgi:hypothetical protein
VILSIKGVAPALTSRALLGFWLCEGDEVVKRLWQRDREELHIVGDNVSLEAGLDIFCKLSGAFDHE